MLNQSICTAAYIEAAEQNLTEKSLSFAHLPGSEIHGPDPLWFATGAQTAGYNGIVKACFPPGEVDEGIQAALKPFIERRLPLTWWTGPSTQPGNLGARLQAHGFVHNRDMIGMCAEIERLENPHSDAPEIEIEPVSSPAEMASWQPIYSLGFGAPPAISFKSLEMMSVMASQPGSCWRHFQVRQAGQIIAISSLFISGETAGLYNLVTRTEERGQGIGAAMTLATFAVGRELGCRIATLQTTYPNALRLYHRLGFEVYCKFGIYQRAAGK